MKTILAINGSASEDSSNEKLIDYFKDTTAGELNVVIFPSLKTLPHFDPQQSSADTPASIVAFRTAIERADGILICTPEYIFSIPSGLKNAIEWCVATTVFSDKPTAIITASANGEKGHDELKMIMRTVMARFTDETTLLIQGVKGKVDRQGNITDEVTKKQLGLFVQACKKLLG